MYSTAEIGFTGDTSPLLRFHFWESFFFCTEDVSLPSDNTEERGGLAGISENVGYDMNFKILNSSIIIIIN